MIRLEVFKKFTHMTGEGKAIRALVVGISKLASVRYLLSGRFNLEAAPLHWE